jgi:predicted transcriptional regulator of viral defense system
MFICSDKIMDKKIEKMLYFTNQDLTKLINPVSVNVFLERETKKGEVLRLKRGIYTTKAKRTEVQIDGEVGHYLEYLTTNVLLAPSYLSLEYVLFSYNIIIENVYAITAVTTKNSAKIINTL